MDYNYLKYKKILIVDDEVGLLEMVTSILEQDGFKEIKTAGTVSEALSVCKEWSPEIAVLDVMLPDGNGFSLFEQMRAFTEVKRLGTWCGRLYDKAVFAERTAAACWDHLKALLQRRNACGAAFRQPD